MHRTHEHEALNGETRVGGGAGSWRANAEDHEDSRDFDPSARQTASYADTALLHLEGEAFALAYLRRLQDGAAQPDELAVLLAFLGSEMMHGACRVIEKALQKGGCNV
jgi:hypothetical protein